ncbi:MAG: hypothetical protein MZV64_35595 [Ignavibacteriales bacterium]|nr:hypothetical protein [Ignavibacteriales bacterium]
MRILRTSTTGSFGRSPRKDAKSSRECSPVRSVRQPESAELRRLTFRC